MDSAGMWHTTLGMLAVTASSSTFEPVQVDTQEQTCGMYSQDATE